jgi:hypothetical protein
VTTAAFVDALLAGQRIELAAEADDVVTWRFEQLEQAGYAEMAALAIAVDTAIDLHLACELLRRGCPQAVALEIIL